MMNAKTSIGIYMVKKAIKIFLDSNVILSGLLSDKGPPRVILDLLCLDMPFLKGVTCEYNLLEIERNIKKRLPTILDIYHSYLPKLRLEIVPLPTLDALKPYFNRIADKDVPVLASAVISGADYLVTGDKKDFDKFKDDASLPLKVVSPSELVILLGHAYSDDR
ncbi:MAG: PIN domain-containing protein [Syntrophales bacterium]